MSDELILEFDPEYIGSAVSPTVDITETTTDVTVTITDFRGEHAYTVDKTDQAIADTEQAATNANTAAANATSTANAAAQYARQTADQAAADAQATADAAAGRADTAAGGANQAAQAATTAAGTANTAASNADAKAALADTAATNADTATQAANTATTNATNAAQTANTAADTATQAAESITDGYFPHMLAGAAEALMGDTDTATFAERVSTHGGVARIESIQGNTVVFNQVITDGGFSDPAAWRAVSQNADSVTVADNVLTLTIADNTQAARPNVRANTTPAAPIAGHKYLLTLEAKKHSAINPTINVYGQPQLGILAVNDTWVKMSKIATGVTSTSQYLIYVNESGATFANGDTISYRNYMVVDLTYMFGAGNEPATVEEFEALFPADYYPYSAGELLSVNIEGVNDREIPVSTYFPDGMTSAGSVHDELTMGKAVKRVGVVDLGTLNWDYNGGAKRFYVVGGISDAKPSTRWNECQSIISNNYTQAYIANSDDGATDVYGIYNRYVYVKDNAYTDAATFKAVMSGVMLYYELAEPVETEITPPLTMTYTVEQGGTEQIVIPTGENSAAPTLAIVYGLTSDGVVDKALSVIAPIEGATASTNYSVNAYLVHDQQLYRVTSAIATGEAIAPGSNCVACTVMGEVIRLTA